MPQLPLTIQFGSNGDYGLWAKNGWYHDPDDKQHTWAGLVGELDVPLAMTRNDVLMRADVISIQNRGMPQEVFVFINGAFAAFWLVREASEQTARIGASLLKAGGNRFSFVTPRAISPKREGLGEDERVMGVAFRALVLSEISD
jgi:hypothetical protein